MAQSIANDITMSEQIRFLSIDQLNQFKRCFLFPEEVITVKRYRFSSEEIILISLTRLSFPNRWKDLYPWFPGRKRWALKCAFYWFINYMVYEWGYLLLNNLEFWLPYFAESAEKIRLKLANLNYQAWRQYHRPSNEVNGFRYALFIDNTMFAFCRPGGNITGEEAAERLINEVQEAWWNGWRKLHGMKWQTVILANGMDAHVFGPLPCRRNDLFSLRESNILELMADVQINEPIKYKIFGDSAYYNNEYIGVGDGRGMSSVRETIEWSYKDVKTLWKFCDYKHVLQLRKQPVGKIFFVCMMMRNIYVTLNASQINTYLDMLPPSLENWTSQGRRARPIPDNCCFSANYRGADLQLNEEENDDFEN